MGVTSMMKVFNQWVATKRALCYTISVAILSQSFVSCVGAHFAESGKGHKYAYTFKMVEPVERGDLSFQDDSLKIEFQFDDATAHFQLQNLSSSILMVRWNQVSFGIDGKFSFVRHSVDFYSDTSWLNTSALIPPQGYILETIVPVQNVSFDGARWIEKDLFRTTDGSDSTVANSILTNVGRTVELVLRLQFGNVQKDYRFGFQVASVREISWDDYRPPKRIALSPTKKIHAELGREFTTAFIVVGFLVFVVFMLSLRKEPVSQ